MKKLSKEHLVKIRELQNILANLEVFDDFQNFIYEHKIKNRQQFDKEFRGLSCRAERYGFINQLKYCPDDKDLVTVEEATKFVKDNNIQSLSELKRKYHKQYLLFIEVRNEIEFPFKSMSWEEYTKDTIQEFINENEIKSRKEFMEKYPNLYWGCHRKDFMKDLVFEQDSAFVRYKIKERFKTVNDINLYLIESGITRFKQLNSTEEGKAIRNYAYRMGWKIEFQEKPCDWTDYK